MEREKRGKSDTDKGKRKIEGDLKVANETIDELNKQKHDVEAALKRSYQKFTYFSNLQTNLFFRKEQELHSMASKLEDEQSLVSKLQKQIKELQSRIQELEEELESERQARSKVGWF